jgi:threonine dehydrogenase-like Zn-dependent dehydrogenase
MGVVPGETVAVVGAGAIGLGCMEMARVAGAGRTIVTDRLDYRLALAKRLGADETVSVKKGDPVAAVKKLSDGRGADLVFECTNKAAGAPQAYEIAATGGRVCLVGIPEEDQIVLDAHNARRKELSVQYVRRSRHAARQAIGLVAAGRLDVASWVTHEFPLEEAPKAFDLVEHYADGVLKAVVHP